MGRCARAVLTGLPAALLLGAEEPTETEGAAPLNGFSVERHVVPRDEIREGGPERDFVRSIDLPSFVSPEDATWVAPPNPVLGVALDGEARAYPVHVMEWHGVVNDVVGEVPLAVVYDPLAGAPVAFRRTIGDRTLTFGVSGLVYNASALLYDRETESLWSPLRGEAVAGALAGTRIARVSIRQEPLGAWLQRAPEALVLMRPDVKRIDYRYSPYSSYWVQDKVPYPVRAQDDRFHAKELVVGVEVGGTARAYIGSLVTEAGGTVSDRLAGREIEIFYDSRLGVFSWEVPEDVRVTESYWFAWKAFHPKTEIWHDPGAAREGS